jgi:molybdate transport system substrate-binding protein
MRWAIVLTVLLAARGAAAGEAAVAVAANFLAPLQKIAAEFSAASGHALKLSAGSTGRLYAQIREQAPFDLFLAADRKHPQRLEDEGSAAAPPFTYAVGRLALWSADAELLPGDGPDVLRRAAFRKLAIASPELAPYGLAAQQALEALGLWPQLQPKLVQGESISQTFQFVATQNAELGFVALSQLSAPDKPAGGSRWLVPAGLHEPIRQDAVLLKRGQGNEAARAAFAFLRSPKARAIIEAYGYGTLAPQRAS